MQEIEVLKSSRGLTSNDNLKDFDEFGWFSECSRYPESLQIESFSMLASVVPECWWMRPCILCSHSRVYWS